MNATEIRVQSSGGAYPVLVGCGIRHGLPELLRRYAPAHRYAVISDDTVAPLYGAPAVSACRDHGLDAQLFTFPAGERHKSRAEWARLTDELLAAGFGRDGAVVAVGGGVTGDLAGFVAATLHRGIPVVQVPTSLVAMIDASVGGKTGVDVGAGKNLVGAFHPPRLVVADPETATTLPVYERAEGLAEAVKHGAITDAAYLDALERDADSLLAGDVDALLPAVLASVAIKARVVGEDEHESGRREVLNFGHTLGHALEAASAYTLGHGSAVSLGMVLEASLGERIGVTEEGTSERLAATLVRFGLPVPPVQGVEVEAALAYLGADKKARAGAPRFVLLRRMGEVAHAGGWSRPVDRELVRDVLAGR